MGRYVTTAVSKLVKFAQKLTLLRMTNERENNKSVTSINADQVNRKHGTLDKRKDKNKKAKSIHTHKHTQTHTHKRSLTENYKRLFENVSGHVTA